MDNFYWSVFKVPVFSPLSSLTHYEANPAKFSLQLLYFLVLEFAFFNSFHSSAELSYLFTH